MTKLKPKISGLIITFNEEDHIALAIQSIDFTDEILVVDAMSTDATPQIVKDHPLAKLISHPFDNFSDQRNFAISKAKYEWILFLDADERITEKLKNEIGINLCKEEDVVAYQFYRQFYFVKKPLYFSSFQRDKTFRLFNKGYLSYNKEKLVHESVLLNGQSKILKNKLDHYSFKDMESYRNKMLHYAKLRARELLKKELTPNYFHFYVKPGYRFLNMFIFRLGFLDGKSGYLIAKAQAYGVRQRYIELKILKSF